MSCISCACHRASRPLDRRTDRPFRNLSEVHYAGKSGLAAAFPIGMYVEYGPFVEGIDPAVYRVVGEPYTSGVNYSAQPQDTAARREACWYILAERAFGGQTSLGLPPHTLTPLTPRMAARLGIACCDCATYVPPCQSRILSCNAGVIQSMRAEAEGLRETIREMERHATRLDEYGRAQQDRANAAEAKLAAVEEALR